MAVPAYSDKEIRVINRLFLIISTFGAGAYPIKRSGVVENRKENKTKSSHHHKNQTPVFVVQEYRVSLNGKSWGGGV